MCPPSKVMCALRSGGVPSSRKSRSVAGQVVGAKWSDWRSAASRPSASDADGRCARSFARHWVTSFPRSSPVSFQPIVDGAIHDSHAAGVEQADDLVVPESGPWLDGQEVRIILRLPGTLAKWNGLGP